MATLVKTDKQVGRTHAGRLPLRVVERTIDFRADKDGNAAAADVVQLINVYGGERVICLGVQVLRAEGAAGVADFGDGADPDGYLADVDINALGKSVSELALTEGTPNAVTGYSNGKTYAADDTIDMVPSIDLDEAKVQVVALILDLFGLSA